MPDQTRLIARHLSLAARRAEGRSGDGTPASYYLNEPEVYDLLDLIGIAHAPTAYLPSGASPEERGAWARQAVALAHPELRLMLKVVGREILHKSDLGGVQSVVLRGASPEEQLQNQAKELLERVSGRLSPADCEGVLACGFVPHAPNLPGQELLLSLRQDPAFGPVVMVGIGGVLTEWYGLGSGGRSRVIFPATQLRADRVATVLAAHPLLRILCTPSRLHAEAPVPMSALTAAVLSLARLGVEFSAAGESAWTLMEIEINPAVASGSGLVALDGLGRVSNEKWPRTSRPLQKIHPLLEPRSAAVLGVSAKGANPGRIILDNLKRSEGLEPQRLYVVHPSEATIAGVPCYAGVRDLPEKVDLAVVSIPAEGARDSIRDLVHHDRTEAIILIPGGFAESGQTDLASAIEQILSRAHEQGDGGPVMVGGNCLGIVSRQQYNTFFLPPYKLPFSPGQGENLALVSQSGAYLVTFASNYDGIIFPKASISFGNQMDLTVADFVAHFSTDPQINVIACYVEGFRAGDGARFLHFAREARSLGKQVIIFKAGKTARGAQAAASHTASLAGDYDVASACLQEAGVTVATTLDEFEDLIKTFTMLSARPLRGRRIGIISNAGFECSTVMDQLAEFELATFDEGTKARIGASLPPFAHRDNPIDATPMANTDAYAASTAAILDCAGVDLAIISSVPVTPALNNLEPDPAVQHPEDLHAANSQPKQLIPLLQATQKPAVIVIDSGRIYDAMARMFEKAGIPVFRKIDRAARALAAFAAASVQA